MEQNLQEILKKRNDQWYKIETYLEDIKVILLWEYHGREDIHIKQQELITILKPDIILHEFLAGWIYNSQKKKFEQQDFRKRTDFDMDKSMVEISKKILHAAELNGSKIIGCDTTMAELEEAMRDLTKRFPKKYKYDSDMNYVYNKRNREDCLTPLSKDVVPYRDKRMIADIIKYEKQTEKPMVVILGQHHTDNIHKAGALKEKWFWYAYVAQIPEDMK